MRFPAHAATTPKSINKHREGKRSFASRKTTHSFAKLFLKVTDIICDIKFCTIFIKMKISIMFLRIYKGFGNFEEVITIRIN